MKVVNTAKLRDLIQRNQISVNLIEFDLLMELVDKSVEELCLAEIAMKVSEQIFNAIEKDADGQKTEGE